MSNCKQLSFLFEIFFFSNVFFVRVNFFDRSINAHGTVFMLRFLSDNCFKFAVVVVVVVAVVVAVAADFFSSGRLVKLKVRLELDFCDKSGVTTYTNERAGCGM